ncbi:MAG: protein kinase domain-containing protein [Chloroflexota bacterium]
MSDELIGKKLGGYEILDRIGQGGMATVYRARQTSMNRTVALKILPRHLMRDDTYLQRFEREVKIIAQLEHRSIVPVHDYGEEDGQPYIAMRYMAGGSVDDLIKQSALASQRALDIINQIAPALDYAHSKNVLHRDLKPSNILLDDDGGAYLTDFGIARILGAESTGTTITTQGVVGTPSYMSPEQAQGHKLDGRSDIYSLGITLFEMLTSRRPFENETPYGIAIMQVTAQPPNPRQYNPEISAAVEQVILKALKKKPENRHQTAVEMAAALEHAVNNPDLKKDDTQPRPIIVNSALDMTQPSQAGRSFENQATVPSGVHSSVGAGSVSPIQPMRPLTPGTGNRTPPPPPSQSVRAADVRSRVRRARRRPGNFWLSMTLGGLLGCALLTLIVVALGMAANRLLSTDDNQTPVTGTAPGAGVIPTLDSISERARQTMVGSIAVPGGDLTTPLFTNVTPIPTRTPLPTADVGEGAAPVGVRPTATFPPGFNPVSSQIIYFDYRESTYNLYSYDLLTGTETALTDDSSSSSYPAISPDGRRIAFQSNRDGNFDIYIMDISSQEAVRLLDTPVDERLASWSHDGEWIVYSSDTRADDTFDLYRVRSDGGAPELIYSDGKRNSHARYSPDDRMLVFTSGAPGDATTWEIVLLELSTGETRRLTDNNIRDASPSFTPDGKHILFNTIGEGLAAIAVIPVDGGEPEIIYDGDGYEWGMHYSPDGRYIIFNEEQARSSQIILMLADGSAVFPIETITGFYPVWVP